MAILRHLPEEKLAEHGLAFKDARIPKLLFHYRARHYFNSLTRAEQIQWQKYRHKKLDQVALQFEQSLQRLIAENSENPTNLTLLQKVYEYGAKNISLNRLSSVNFCLAYCTNHFRFHVARSIKNKVMEKLIRGFFYLF
ncbi:exodeoxyribonuclease I [Pasteurella multocida]|nr:exodeoxyribonuclease I [Pasteurella multocida]